MTLRKWVFRCQMFSVVQNGTLLRNTCGPPKTHQRTVGWEPVSFPRWRSYGWGKCCGRSSCATPGRMRRQVFAQVVVLCVIVIDGASSLCNIGRFGYFSRNRELLHGHECRVCWYLRDAGSAVTVSTSASSARDFLSEFLDLAQTQKCERWSIQHSSQENWNRSVRVHIGKWQVSMMNLVLKIT
jgi:hypothetical protein